MLQAQVTTFQLLLGSIAAGRKLEKLSIILSGLFIFIANRFG